MGLEVYLMGVQFKEEVNRITYENFLKSKGFVLVKRDNFGTSYELYTKKGITEIMAKYKANKIKYFYIRFAILNPNTVIKQTIEFLQSLLQKFTAKIFDFEREEEYATIGNVIFKIHNRLRKKRAALISEAKGVLKPIRGGQEVFDYIRNHKTA